MVGVYSPLDQCMIDWFFFMFNIIKFSLVSPWPVHLSMLSCSPFERYFPTVFFPIYVLLSHIIIIQTMGNSERGINPDHWVSSILWKTMGRARDRTTDLLLSSPVRWPTKQHSRLEIKETWMPFHNLLCYQPVSKQDQFPSCGRFRF